MTKKTMMRFAGAVLILLLLLGAVSCNRQPESVLEQGNQEPIPSGDRPDVSDTAVTLSYSDGIFSVTYSDGSVFAHDTAQPVWASLYYQPSYLGELSSYMNSFQEINGDAFLTDFFTESVSAHSIKVERVYNHAGIPAEDYYELYGDYDDIILESARNNDPMVVVRFEENDVLKGAIVLNNSGELVWVDQDGNYYQTDCGGFKTARAVEILKHDMDILYSNLAIQNTNE